MSYMAEALYDMYPEMYHRVYPVVKRCCEMYDVPGNPEMYPYPTRAGVEHMADYCYNQLAGMLGPDAIQDYETQQGARGIFRTLILILLIRQLLRRR